MYWWRKIERTWPRQRHKGDLHWTLAQSSQYYIAPTADKFELIKKGIRNRKIDAYKGHDIVKISLDYQEDYRQLDAAGVYTHDLTVIMLKEIMKADRGNEDFLYKLRPIKEQLWQV